MAWNVTQGGKVPQKRTQKKSMRPLFWVVGGIVAITGVCIVAMVFSNCENVEVSDEGSVKKKRTTVIVKSKPATVKKYKVESIVEESGNRTNRWGEVVKRKKPETYVDDRGIMRYKKGNGRVPNPEDFKNPTRISNRGNIHEFKHPIENEIAALIMTQPGEFLVGEPDYSNLKQDFVNALLQPIEIGEDDNEVDKELKKNVEEIKRELAERVKGGEDLVEILKEARRELRQSAEYKRNLDEIVQEQLYNPEISDEDLTSTFEAANKMLEAKGIEPMSEKRILRARSRMLRAQERRNAAAAASSQVVD
jgi:hypothetical protein